MLTLSGFRHVRFEVIIFPATLNNLSEASLVAQIQKYFRASLESVGYIGPYCFHHSRGSASVSSCEVFIYLLLNFLFGRKCTVLICFFFFLEWILVFFSLQEGEYLGFVLVHVYHLYHLLLESWLLLVQCSP